MANLYEIALAYRADAAKLEDLDLDPQALEDTLEAIGGELETKAVNTAMVLRNLEASAAAIKEAEAQMAARRKALENRAARLKDWLLGGMLAAGVQKIECPQFRLCVRENPPAVEIYEPGTIPAEYMKTPEPPPPCPDKAAIKAAIQGGKEVPGARLSRGQRLDIR